MLLLLLILMIIIIMIIVIIAKESLGGAEHPETLTALSNLGATLRAAGRHQWKEQYIYIYIYILILVVLIMNVL